MNHETRENTHTRQSPIKREETHYMNDEALYHGYGLVQVENNSEWSEPAPTSPPVFVELSNSSVQPLQPWSTNVPFDSVKQNHQQIQYLSHIQQYEDGNLYIVETQDRITRNNDIGEKSRLRKNDSRYQQSKQEVDDLRKWRKRPKLSENKDYTEDFKRLEKQRVMANVRERQRTQNLNEAFVSLRQIVPTMSSEKLTKIQIVQLATRYIEFLCQILTNGETSDTSDHGKFTQEKLSFAFSVWRMEGKWTNEQI